MRDVAKECGVASSTVSHVFNGTAPVSETTRERVLETAARLGYKRTRRRKRKTTMVGVIFHGFKFGRRAPMVYGALEYLQSRGVRALVAASKAPFSEGCTLDSVAQGLGLRSVQGVIVVTDTVKQVSGLFPGKLPGVVALGFSDRSNLPSVIPDFFQGARDATRHLIGLGHRRIYLLNGPRDAKSARDREEGYRAALAAEGLSFDPELVTYGTWNAEDGYRRIKEALTSGVDLSAVFGGNDYLALGCIDALREQGLSVPDQIAVVGYDNTETASSMRPPLTSVQLPTRQLGHVAARLLLEQIEAESNPDKVGPNSVLDATDLDATDGVSNVLNASVLQIPCPLVVRESCGAKKIKSGFHVSI